MQLVGDPVRGQIADPPSSLSGHPEPGFGQLELLLEQMQRPGLWKRSSGELGDPGDVRPVGRGDLSHAAAP